MTCSDIAIVFPGQGSQKTGMGKWIYDNFSSARPLFEEINDALGMNLTDIMFCEEYYEQLKLTENAQPAIMAVSIAALRVLTVEFGLDPIKFACCAAGHSLGEYTALITAGMFSVSDGAKLLRKRGLAMQKAVPLGIGGMLAILGINDILAVEEIAGTAAEKIGPCEVANDNCPGQSVLSGYKTALEFAGALAKERGARTTVLLDVSVPSHCSLMSSVSDIMKSSLAEVEKGNVLLPIIQNYTAKAETDKNTIIENLVAQITGRVRWRESMLLLTDMGVNKILEFGPGNVLKGLAKRTIPDIEVLSMNSIEDIESAVSMISGKKGGN